MQTIYVLNEIGHIEDYYKVYTPIFASTNYKSLKDKKAELLVLKKKHNKKAKKKNKIIKFINDNCKFVFDEEMPVKERGMNAGLITGSSEEIKEIRRKIEIANKAIKARWQIAYDEWLTRYNIASKNYIDNFIEANNEQLSHQYISLLSQGKYPSFIDKITTKYVIKKINTI